MNQLSLFTRRKARKPPPAKEFPVHCMVADLLRLALVPGWVWFHPANGEFRDHVTGARLKRMGLKPGVSDFILIAPPNGCAHTLELKRRGLKPTHEQAQFLAEVVAAGGVAAWADGFDEAVAILKGWGALKRSLHES